MDKAVYQGKVSPWLALQAKPPLGYLDRGEAFQEGDWASEVD